VPEEEYQIPLGKAEVKREGTDVSLITYGRMLPRCLEAAQVLAGEGISAEVLDLRTLSPLDTQAVLATAGKTGRVLIVHEAVEFAGFGGEIAATIAQSDVFYGLKAPIRRLGGAFVPVPFSPVLEDLAFPTVQRITDEAREVCRRHHP